MKIPKMREAGRFIRVTGDCAFLTLLESENELD